MYKFILNLFLGILIFSGPVFVLAENTTTEGVVCTMDVKICPDGSGVGRVGPNCEFARCPTDRPASTSQKIIPKIKSMLQIRNEKNIQTRNGTTTEKQEIKVGAQERIASTTERKIERRFEIISKKYLTLVKREEAIMLKLSTRIEKIKSAGGNTEEAEKLMVEAKTHLMEARKSYELFNSYAIKADQTTTPNEILTDLKNSGKIADNHLREAHRLMLKIVGLLKGVSGLNATTTVSN